MTPTWRPCSAAVSAVIGSDGGDDHAVEQPGRGRPARGAATKPADRRRAGERHGVDPPGLEEPEAPAGPSSAKRRPIRRRHRRPGAARLELPGQHVPRFGGAHQQHRVPALEPGPSASTSPSARYSAGTTSASIPPRRSASAVSGPIAATRRPASSGHRAGSPSRSRNAATPLTLVKTTHRKSASDRIARRGAPSPREGRSGWWEGHRLAP